MTDERFNSDTARQAFHALAYYKRHLTRQQFKTLNGQIKAGNITGAMRGLDNILSRKGL